VTQEELLRLIDEAAADGRPTLDLAGEGLGELPPEIGKLTNLKTLVLGRWDKKKLKRLGNNLKALPDELGQLTELRSLFLYGNEFTSLPEVVGKLGKLRSLDLGGNQLSTLPEIVGQLTSLRSLDLSSNQLSILPEIVGQLTSLRSLDISGTWLSELPEIVGQLTNLRSLDLGGNQLSTLPEIVGQLTSLQTLSLTSNQLSELPEIVGQLTSLQSLYLGFNRLSELPETTGQLTNLQTLNLWNNQLSELPEIVGQLTSLRSLNLGDNQLSTLPKIVGQLTSLQTLNLGYNQLSELPEIVGQLTSSQTLYLGGNQLSMLPEIVGQLTSLRSLDLSNNQLSTLPEIVGQLTSLQSLDLRNNQLSTLPEIVGQLTSLQSLDLSNNHLNRLPEVLDELSHLQTLSLRNNQLNSLPKWAKTLEKLTKLDLRGNPLPIPPEILGPKERYENPSPASKTLGFYFSLQAESGSIPLYEAKLILIGEGGAGKTSLAKKINNDDYTLPKDEASTEGIDVIRWDFPMPNGNSFRVNIWDFGGQDIYHATHQFFLTKRSLYLLVADIRQENTDFYYWLKIVELLSDSSPVLVIKNEKQDRKCEIDESLFKSQFNNLKDHLPTNLSTNRGLADIKDAIRYHISKLPHVGNPLPKIWVRVRAALENLAQNSNTITVDQYFDLCRQNGFTDKEQMLSLSSYLHDLGVCLHFQDDKLLKRTLILKPEWATAAVYKVADSETVCENKGRFSDPDIAKIWHDSQYSNLRDELLQLMLRFKLAYELPSHRGHYIAPQLLPLRKPDYPWDATDNLILRYHYDFMPKGILTRFIVETHQLIEDQNHVWKNGVVLADKWGRAEIIENYPKNEINIRVSGSNKKPLLEIVRYELWKIHRSYERLDYEELIPCNCPQCKGSAKPKSYSYALLMKYLGDHRYNIECRGSYESVDVRRLINDITEHPHRSDLAELDSEAYFRKARQDSQRFQPSSFIYNDHRKIKEIHQHGSGDNIAQDKVGQDKIGHDKFESEYKNKSLSTQPDLNLLSEALDALIESLSEEYNANNSKGQDKIQRDALATIQSDPALKAQLTDVFKSHIEATLEQLTQNPLTKILIKSLKASLSAQ
jgi:Leucine-rich repeat (LRR) protein/GTPase SAR1 family protein